MLGNAFSPRLVSTARNFAGLLVGLIFGLILNGAVAYAQSTVIHMTASGSEGAEVECSAQVALTYSVDGGPETPVPNLVWAGAGPYIAKVAYPNTAGARTIGPHTFRITNPGATITLSNGDPYVIPPGSATFTVNVLADTPVAAPPRFLRWLKILVPILAGAAIGLVAWLG